MEADIPGMSVNSCGLTRRDSRVAYSAGRVRGVTGIELRLPDASVRE